MVTKRIFLSDNEECLLLCGEQDSNLRGLEKKHGVQIFARSSVLAIRGKSKLVDHAIASLEELRKQIRLNKSPYKKENENQNHLNSSEPVLVVTPTGKKIRALTSQQHRYVSAISSMDMVMAVGPAGTGKTFLAAVCAILALRSGRVQRIILTRPVVEAGEKLGFLPGDLYEKVHPYLKPLYDTFLLLLGADQFRTYREDETIEIVPLAYMRGRTLEDSFVILDEAQNTIPSQMKMFLTRMGLGSKMVITGDITQVDLDSKKESGFIQSLKILKNIPEICFIHFSEVDIVRHSLVKKIIKAYEESEKK